MYNAAGTCIKILAQKNIFVALKIMCLSAFQMIWPEFSPLHFQVVHRLNRNTCSRINISSRMSKLKRLQISSKINIPSSADFKTFFLLRSIFYGQTVWLQHLASFIMFYAAGVLASIYCKVYVNSLFSGYIRVHCFDISCFKCIAEPFMPQANLRCMKIVFCANLLFQ